MATGNTAAKEKEYELVLTRIFDAPRELLFKVWTDPKHVSQWWGPHGFANPICELDLRPGGTILIHMRGPDGTVYPMTGVYQGCDTRAARFYQRGLGFGWQRDV